MGKKKKKRCKDQWLYAQVQLGGGGSLRQNDYNLISLMKSMLHRYTQINNYYKKF